MEKCEILKCHENFIQATYASIREYEKENKEIDDKIKALEDQLTLDHDLSRFYSLYAKLMGDKTLNVSGIADEISSILVSRSRIFLELGLIDEEERDRANKIATDNLVEYYDLEYKLRLIELASIEDMESDEYVRLVALIEHYKKDNGAVYKSIVLKKDIQQNIF